MVSLNKSFLWGTLFASLTWTVSFYLYWRLTNASSKSITSYAPTATLFDDGLSKSKKSLNDFPFKNEKWKHNVQSHADDDVRIFNIQSKNNEKYNGKNYRLQKYDKNKITFNEKMKQYRVDYKNKINKNSNSLIESLQPIANENSELDELGMVHTSEEQRVKDDGYKKHAFNVLVSKKISYYRDIVDTRNALCQEEKYPENLPHTSIIICFYNEHLETLLRSIYSVFVRTPEYLVKEIILVDDYSDDEDIKHNLGKEIHAMFNDKSEHMKPEWEKKVHLVRARHREGLIRARVIGSRNASGEVLVFLDSHIEVNKDWLQPLLTRISLNKTTVVMPVIDIINPDTFKYTPSPLVRGGFNWGLHFKWDNLPKGTLVKSTDFVKPIRSPTMAGGLFAMDRRYFKDLGEYDMGMDVWGGENLEISFRIWMCGGTLELIPCSRIGHVFRKRRPYGSPGGGDSMLKNSLRVAHVWLDEYKDYFLKDHKSAKDLFYGDVSERKRLREELKCKTFKWYLDNVYPERLLPGEKPKEAPVANFQPWHSRKRNYTSSYQIRLSGTTLCVTSAGNDPWKRGGVLTLQTCLRVKHQIWSETVRSELVLGQLLCLDASSSRDPTLGKCHEMGGDQEWKHKGENGTPIYNMASGTCLGVPQDAVIGTVINMILCSNEDAYKLKWDLVR